MTESQVFECANCNDRYLITGKEHVIHKGEEVLESRNFRMAFKVNVSEFKCAVCGAEYSNDRWRRKIKDGNGHRYEELVNGEWTTTPWCEERTKREREALERVRKAQESIKQKATPKKDGRRRA
jgi:hypothetical protein